MGRNWSSEADKVRLRQPRKVPASGSASSQQGGGLRRIASERLAVGLQSLLGVVACMFCTNWPNSKLQQPRWFVSLGADP